MHSTFGDLPTSGCLFKSFLFVLPLGLLAYGSLYATEIVYSPLAYGLCPMHATEIVYVIFDPR